MRIQNERAKEQKSKENEGEEEGRRRRKKHIKGAHVFLKCQEKSNIEERIIMIITITMSMNNSNNTTENIL